MCSPPLIHDMFGKMTFCMRPLVALRPTAARVFFGVNRGVKSKLLLNFPYKSYVYATNTHSGAKPGIKPLH